ncbi:MAG: type II toxin-antitoxin system RelE/ParE family toxin [Kiritimatiellia bacterium]|jgi:proteic killer suppression protein|nr:type II toxin-antitoxin system RelE/ParE family toxin [Kiritimatiellia bacterium]
MIQNFAHKALQRFFEDGSTKAIQPAHRRRIADILDLLDAAHKVQDMDFPGSGLHPLKGKLKGYWAVKVSENWRVIFQFTEGHAYRVNYIDYH